MQNAVALFAESFHEWFNQQPWAQFVALGLLATFGVYLVQKGRRGVNQGVLHGAWGQVFTGKSARRNGLIFCGIGAVMLLYAAVATVVKLL